MKVCSRCGQEKESAAFYPSKILSQGLRSACKDCERGSERNLAKDRANNQKWFQENKKKRRDYARKKKYGVTPDQVDAALAAQGYGCAICETTEPGGRFNEWQVDHDHKTGEFRGVLCYRCNQLLGYARDSTVILDSASSYLKGEHNEQQR